jgi:hypothetical protein
MHRQQDIFGGQMQKFAVFMFFALLIGSAVIFVSCGGDEYEQSTRGLTDEDGTYAKDRNQDQPCNQYDVKLADCYDACSCCDARDTMAQVGDTLTQCIWYCDGLILKINDVEHMSKANITQYKECVVGCFSICDKEDKEVACWQECKGYLGE